MRVSARPQNISGSFVSFSVSSESRGREPEERESAADECRTEHE
jgi:hypothetical protein